MIITLLDRQNYPVMRREIMPYELPDRICSYLGRFFVFSHYNKFHFAPDKAGEFVFLESEVKEFVP